MAFKQRVSEFQSVLSAREIDLKHLKRLCFSGIPDGSGIRSLCWKLMLGYLPLQRDLWPETLKCQRATYKQFVREFIIEQCKGTKSGKDSKEFDVDHPLNPNPDSNWLAFFKDNEVLLQIDKDCRRLCPDISFFQIATKFPNKDVTAGNDRDFETLRERVLRTHLEASQVNTNRSGLKNLSVPRKIAPEEYIVLGDEQEAHWETPEKFRRLCPDISFFQIATKFPNKDVTAGNDRDFETLRERVLRTHLEASQVNTNRSGLKNLSVPRKIAPEEYIVLGDEQEAHWEVVERILYIYAKLNPGLGYVQGMNEIIGPLYYVFCSDPNAEWQEHVEADAFFCFTNLMSEIRDNFIKSLDDSECGIGSMMKSVRRLLKERDPLLFSYLEEQQMRPQFYSFRWLTLLLSQEFALPDVIRVWDSLFADESRFDFLIYVCCAMHMVIRDQILAGDFATTMKLLQNYPDIDIHTILSRAIELKRPRTMAPSPPPAHHRQKAGFQFKRR